MRVGLFALVTVCMLSGAAAARALPPAAAEAEASYERLVNEAFAEYEAHRYEEALALFNKAHALLPNARSLRAMALAEYELRRYVACVAHLQEALASQVKPITGDLRRQTEDVLRKAEVYVARVLVQVLPTTARARITVDDAPSVPVPADAALVLQVGEHLVVVDASGFEPVHQTLVVAAGGEQTLRVVLRPISAAPERALAPSPAAAASVWHSPWLWTGVGAAVVGGVVLGVLASQGGSTTTAPGYQGNLGTLKGPSNP